MSNSINSIEIKNDISKFSNKKYKINILSNGITKKIIIFYGKYSKNDDENIYNDLLTKDENNLRKNKKIEVSISEQVIHYDDTISSIKVKILNELKQDISVDELYLYCQKKERLNSISIYQSLTQNKKLELTKIRLEQFLSNVKMDENGEPIDEPPQKETYTFDDIYEMKFNDKKYIVNKVLGQKFFIVENEYPFVCNPYDVQDYDLFFEKYARKSLTTLNSHLLLNTGEIENDTIFLCLAEDVLKYVENKDISQETTIKIYFPFLFNKQITSLEDIREKKEQLIESNKKILNEKTLQFFQTIDMFYDVYKLKKTELNYIQGGTGIKYIKAVMLPEFEIKLPLEIIFKIVHATQENPLIKYNPSSRQENIYRMFTDKIATNGRKIPYLKKATIFKLVKTIARTKSVAVYIEKTINNISYFFICEFTENGYITISSEFINPISLDNIDDIFRQTINPIIDEIRNVLEQSGYKLNKFDSLDDENIEIKQLTYETKIEIKSFFDIDKYKGCISSVFINETNRFKDKDIQLRFKRVSNFSKLNSQEAFILEKSEQGLRGEQLIDALIENFPEDLNRQQAIEIVTKVANELEIERGAHKSDIKIKDNPGFKTIITSNKELGIITITTTNINNINYCYTLPIYLDTMIRLTQNIDSTSYSSQQINNICSIGEREESEIEDIISSVELPLNKTEVPSLESDDEEIQYTSYKLLDMNKPQGALSLFYDEEDEEDEDYQGGKSKSKNSDSSEESVESNEYSENEQQQTPIVLSNETEDEEEVKVEEKKFKNIDGMKLNKPYYFQNLIEKKEPILIIKEDTPQYNSYPRTCPSNSRRQPVILTDVQLNNINKEYPGFLRKEDVIKYGSDPKNKYNYICPRYWCLKNDTIIRPEDLKEVKGKDGKKELQHPTCGKVLPKGEKKVKPGYYIYEFYEEDKGKKKSKRYPGLIPDKHPDGYCLPCCFNNYNTQGRIKANTKCLEKKIDDKTDDKEVAEERVEEIEGEAKEEDKYIKGPEKFPLEPGRWGFLPPQIQTMLHSPNEDCKKISVEKNEPCLLRHGVQFSKKQSFIASISDIFCLSKKKPILSIKDMRELIKNSLTIDNYIRYQNGNLVNDFYDKDKKVDTKNYESGDIKLFNKLDMNKPEDKIYYNKVISSFENFKNYLSDNDAIIDHTYLWDIVSIPNTKLFERGLNLVILDLPDDDITNNVQILCPTNHYSNEFYNAHKPTTIIMRRDGFYEPICLYTKRKNKGPLVKVLFDETYNKNLPANIKAVFKEIIKPSYNDKCKPLPSMPNTYKKFKRPWLLHDLVELLENYKQKDKQQKNQYIKKRYDIIKYVMNFNNKVIGIVVKDLDDTITTGKIGFVPCYPSSIDLSNLSKDLEVVFMNDLSIWNTYENTVKFLNRLYTKSKKRNTMPIPCQPVYKVVEDGIVIGILTETNQFIQISRPIFETDIEEFNPITNKKNKLYLPSFDNDNYIVKIPETDNNKNFKNEPMIQTEIEMSTQNGVDNERIKYVKKIKMETNFYNVFRNTIRILINDYDNVKIREKIELEMSKEYVIYSEKLTNIDRLLHELVKNNITFDGDKNYHNLINEVTTCIIKDKKNCSESNLCIVKDDNCILKLPKYNLMTGKENEPIYYKRVADELIRYNRIRGFMLQPQVYLSFGNIEYNLKDNEIILIETLLTQDYFENLIPSVTNKYVKSNSYDEVEPIETQQYDNVVLSLDHIIGRKNTDICETKENSITSGLWRKCFPNNYTEIVYSRTNYCTFNFVIDFIKKTTNKKLNVNDIKQELFNQYEFYLNKSNETNKYRDKIINIIIREGKRVLGDQLKSGKLSFELFINTDIFFLTPFDLWLLIEKYKIPSIFISEKFLLLSKKNNKEHQYHEFVCYGNENDKFVFLYIPGLRDEIVPMYRLIQSHTKDVFISLNNLNNEECVNRIVKAIERKITIEQYLDEYTIQSTTNYRVKKPLNTTEIKRDDNTVLLSDNTEEEKRDDVIPILTNNKNKTTKKNKNNGKTKKNKVNGNKNTKKK